MSEYYAATKNEAALNYAIELYRLIEVYSYDEANGGYLEAFTRDWDTWYDVRLSNKDANEAKTMNTHLHVIEAYSNLYKVWNDEILKEKISGLLTLFDDHFINIDNCHLRLFFNEQWQEKPDVISFGHDIEAAWLLQRCAEIIRDEKKERTFRQFAVSIAEAAAEGLSADGGLWYEYNPSSDYWVKEKHSWPQAEAMIGFFNVYQLTGDLHFIDVSLQSWAFIKEYILDHKKGEWYWGIKDDYHVMPGQDKAGFWKCPYHNTRACLEIIRRLTILT